MSDGLSPAKGEIRHISSLVEAAWYPAALKTQSFAGNICHSTAFQWSWGDVRNKENKKGEIVTLLAGTSGV